MDLGKFLLVLFTLYCFSIISLVENKTYLLVKHQDNGDISGTDYVQAQTNTGNPVSNAVSNPPEKARRKSKARSSIGHKDMTYLRHGRCKDCSHLCITISTKSCTKPILSDVCKRTCGLCNDNQLPLPPQQPSLPSPPQLPLPRPPQLPPCPLPSGGYICMRDVSCTGRLARHYNAIDSLNAAVNECNRLLSCRCIVNYHGNRYYSLRKSTATHPFFGATTWVIN